MPPIDIDKILSDPLLIVAAVLLIVSPILFLVAFVKFLRTPKTPVSLPHHEMESPISARGNVSQPAEEQQSTPMASLQPLPPSEPEPEAVVAPAPVVRRAESASEKTVIMPPGMAEMHSEMEIAFSQIKLLNKKVAALEKELARLHSEGSAGSASASTPPHPL